MTTKEQYWKYGLIIVIVFFGILIFSEFSPFLSGLLGACTVYVLVRKQMKYLTNKKKIKKSLAALLIMVEVSLCFLVPAFLLIWLAIGQIERINLDPSQLISSVQHITDLIEAKTGYYVFSKENMTSLVAFSTKMGQMILGQISGFIINAVVMLFILYFMLVGREEMEAYIYEIIPFKENDKKEVLSNVKVMVTSNAIGIPLLAIIQGFVATIGYLIFGMPNPIILGFLTCFATIIPLVGTSLVWFPSAVYLALTGDWFNAIGLAIYALLIISNVDNLFRFMLQKKMANIHPLITVFGVVMGLSLFGFWGVIFGPLLLSVFLLCVNIFKKNYLDSDVNTNV